jgi:hypothetical protein
MSNRFHRLAAVPTAIDDARDLCREQSGLRHALAHYGLLHQQAAGAVDDRKTAMSQADVPIDPDATRIRTADLR